MRFRKIAVALTIVFMSLSAKVHAAPYDAVIAAIQGSARHAQRLEGLTLEQQSETLCLALNLYHEARGSTERDILGVAHVTQNRITQARKPSGFCSTIWERGQYSWTVRNTSALIPKELGAWNKVVGIARNFVLGEETVDFTNGANTFYSRKLGTPSWTRGGTRRQIIGAHVYVRMPR